MSRRPSRRYGPLHRLRRDFSAVITNGVVVEFRHQEIEHGGFIPVRCRRNGPVPDWCLTGLPAMRFMTHSDPDEMPFFHLLHVLHENDADLLK